jgi:hypothetical protein
LAQIAPDMTDLGNQVTGGPWYESSHRPWNAVVATVALQRRRLAREAAIARVRPEYDALERRIAPLIVKGYAANKAVNNLTA